MNFGKTTPRYVLGDQRNVYEEALTWCHANDGDLFVGLVGSQAGRACFATAVTVHQFLKFTETNRLENPKGEDYAKVEDVKRVSQRAVRHDHVKEIVAYIRARLPLGPVIMPGVILNNHEGEGQLFVLRGMASRLYAAMVIREDAPLLIADGMHRLLAFRELLNPTRKEDRLTDEAVQAIKNMILPVMITFEPDNDQLRDDFADVAQAQPIDRSIVVAFGRNIVNIFTERLIEAVPFFKLHTAAGAGQTNPNSAHAWTTATLKRVFASFIAGARSNNDDALSSKIETNRKRTSPKPGGLTYDEFATAYWTGVQRAFDAYSRMGGCPPRSPANFMRDLRREGAKSRDNMVLLSISGLEVLARIGFDLWESGLTTPTDISACVTALASQVEWSGDNEIWLGNIIPSAGHSVLRNNHW